MADRMSIYLICVGICLVVVIISVIATGLIIFKWKKRLGEFENEKQRLEIEKNQFFGEYNQLKKEQEDLRNAQILFRKEKEASADLSKKTEKDIAIDLFVKFMEMESTFDYMRNNLASIDSKIVGVKNYSEDLISMKDVLTVHLDSLKAEMTDMQKRYSITLSAIHEDLKKSLANIEERIEGIVSSITEKKMQGMSQNVNSKLEEMENVVKTEITQLSSVIDKRVAHLATEFGTEIEKKMPSILDGDDVENAVRNVFNYYTISDLDKEDVKYAVNSALDDVFSYSYNFEEGMKSAIRDEVQSAMSYPVTDLSSIEDQIRRLEELVNNTQ